METTWDKTRAIGFAVGMHVFVLMLLCLSFMREPQQQIAGTQMSIIEASLVTTPPQSEFRVAELMPQQQPKVVALRVPPPQRVEVRQAGELVAEHSEQQDSDVHPNEPLIDPPRQQQQGDEYPQHTAKQQSDPPDLLREMREQRAEQERERQLTAQGSAAPQVQRIQHAQVDGPNALPVPAKLLAENGIADQGFLDPFSITVLFNQGADGTSDDGRQLMSCPVSAFQQSKDDMIPIDWIDCMLNPARYRLTGQMMQTIDFPHIGFAPAFSIQDIAVDQVGTEPQASPQALQIP